MAITVPEAPAMAAHINRNHSVIGFANHALNTKKIIWKYLILSFLFPDFSALEIRKVGLVALSY